MSRVSKDGQRRGEADFQQARIILYECNRKLRQLLNIKIKLTPHKSLSLIRTQFLGLIAFVGMFTAALNAQQKIDPIHNAGTKLLETAAYTVYKSRPYYENLGRFDDNFCGRYFADRSQNEVRVILVHKVNADYVITDDKEFRRRFEEEIFPVVKQQCSNIGAVFIFNYIYNVRLCSNDQEFSYGQQCPQGYSEEALNQIYVYPEQGKFRYEVHAENNTNSRTYTSLANFRKVRSELTAARLKRQEAEDLERRRVAAIESKGGIEPTSEELAVAYTQYLMQVLPHCGKLDKKEWCEVNFDLWVRLKGGSKKSCTTIVIGQDYHCEYNVQYDCHARNDPKNPLYCAHWTAASGTATTVNTGIRRTLNGWVVYPLKDRKGKQ